MDDTTLARTVAAAVATLFCVDIDDIFRHTRRRDEVLARQTLMDALYRALESQDRALSRVAQALGRDYSTVIHGRKSIAERAAEDPELERKVERAHQMAQALVRGQSIAHLPPVPEVQHQQVAPDQLIDPGIFDRLVRAVCATCGALREEALGLEKGCGEARYLLVLLLRDDMGLTIREIAPLLGRDFGVVADDLKRGRSMVHRPGGRSYLTMARDWFTTFTRRDYLREQAVIDMEKRREERIHSPRFRQEVYRVG